MGGTRRMERRAAAGTGYGERTAAEYAALTRRALRDLHAVMLELDTERREIRRLGRETREILSALAA